MGGKSGQTAGYRFKLRNHNGLTYGPLDAYLEFRGGDKTAWSGRQTASGTIAVNAPKLWGGDKDQGGIVGNLYVMMGEATQLPNSMLVSAFGDQTCAWRGFATVAFDGLYGSNNPYPQPQSHKIEKILKGWDGDACWYPEKAAVGFTFGFPGDPGTSGAVAQLPLASDFSDGLGNTWFRSPSEDSNNTRIIDGAAYFSGRFDADAGAYLFCNDSFGTLNECCIRAKIKPDTGTYTQRLTIFSSDNGVLDFRFGLTTDLKLFAKRDSVFAMVVGTSVVPTDAFTDVALIVANGVATIYVNEVAEGSVPADVATENVTLSAIGRWRGAQQEYFKGFVKQFSITDPTAPANFSGINPAHALYYLRTQSHKGGEPTANVDDASFTAAADRLYAEGFGICVRHDPDQESIEDIENRICKLIGGSVNRSPVDGKLHLDLARGDYVLDDLPVVSDDDILDFSELPTTPEGAVNSVSIRYFDPQRKETIITPSVDALGLIDEFGLNHQVIDYPEIPVASLAARIANRELLQFITPSRAFDLACKPSLYALQPNQYFRLQVPKRGIDDMVCIVGDKQGGTLKSGAIRLQAAQVADTLPDFSSIDVEIGVDPTPPTTPTAITAQIAFEAPYLNVCTAFAPADLALLAPEAGFLIAAAQDPSTSRDFTLTVDAGAGYVEQGDGDWTPTLVINEAAALEDPLPVDFTFSAGKRLSEVSVGDVALWGSELCRVDALDEAGGTLTLGRGCGDTVPAEHAAGETLWVYGVESAHDGTEYTDGETVAAKLLTNTFSQQLALADAVPVSVTFEKRQARPYPPGKVRLGGAVYPTTVSGVFAVTWTHRDRVQQVDQLLDTEASSVGPEATVRYGLLFKRADTSAILAERDDLAGASATVTLAYAGDVTMELYAISDSGESWQRHSFTFAYSSTAPYSSIDGLTYDPADGATVIDGGVVSEHPPTTPVGPTPAVGGTGVASTIAARTHGTTVVDPVTYGASPSASAATNTAAFNSAYAALPTSGVNQGGIVRPSIAGTYMIDPSTSIKPLSYTQLDLATNGVTLQEIYTATDHKYGVWVDGKTQVEFVGGRIIGYRDSWSAIAGTTSEWGHCFFISNGSTAISFKNCSISKAVGDAISVGYTCSDVMIDQCLLTNCRRQGVSAGGDNVLITNTEISYISGTSPQAGVDFEPDYPATSTGGIVDGCHIHHCAGPSVQMYKRGNSATVQNCVLEYCNRGIYAVDSTGGIVKDNTIRYHLNSGIYLKGASTGWTIGGTGDANALYGNKTSTYGAPAAGGTTTTVTGQSAATAKHLTIDSTASATVGANTYGPV